jgi:hypothetical protein
VNGQAQFIDSRLELAETEVSQPSAIECFGVVRIALEGLIEVVECLRIHTKFQPRSAAKTIGVEILVVDLDRPGGVLGSQFVALQVQPGPGALLVGFAIFGSQAQRLAQRHDGLLIPAAEQVLETFGEVGVGTLAVGILLPGASPTAATRRRNLERLPFGDAIGAFFGSLGRVSVVGSRCAQVVGSTSAGRFGPSQFHVAIASSRTTLGDHLLGVTMVCYAFAA